MKMKKKQSDVDDNCTLLAYGGLRPPTIASSPDNLICDTILKFETGKSLNPPRPM